MPSLEPQFHDVLICKKNDCRPFLEVLVEEPENISRQNLGILIGIFQIDDYSEDSSYVVNYLISIIKKEYFSRANRGPVENFEAALHKANLALAKLATHENIGWIGKINAICAVIEKNNLLLSQTGNASAFLLRGTTMTEITEMPDTNIDSNPLKTFQDVISGRIEIGDKLLFTTKEIFDIFSLEEIKKSALKFSRENFIQFLNTALVNELDQAVVLVTDMLEKVEEPVEIPRAKRTQDLNVFSQTAFQKELSPKMLEKERAREEAQKKERQEIIQELKGEVKDFTDKKTGHIYIKESHNISQKSNAEKIDFDPSEFFKEKISGLTALSVKLFKSTKIRAGILSRAIRQKIGLKIARIKIKKERSAQENQFSNNEIVVEKEKDKTFYSELEIKTRLELALKRLQTEAGWLKDKTADALVLILQKPASLTLKSIAILKEKWRNRKTREQIRIVNKKRYPWENTLDSPNLPKTEFKETPTTTSKPAAVASTEKTAGPRQFIEPKKILPDFSRLKQIVSGLDQKQKISALIILVLLFIVPYWIVRWEDKKIEKKPETAEVLPVVVVPLEKDLNVTRIEKLDTVYSGNITKIIGLNNKFFAQTEAELIDLENKKSFPLPENFQNPELFLGMDDLNLIFLVKNSQITSFAPITGKFLGNTLAFPQGGKIVDAKTYLTYIYLLDANNNQIYRAPRAEGGFGEKTAWLKDNLDLSNAKSLAINENIFVINGQNILKLFRGKKLDFSIENTQTPIAPDKLYAQNSGTNLYVLDKTNARIVKLDNDGKIIAQYYNENIKNATDFSVSEESNLVYISDSSGIKSFGMNQ